MSSVTKEGAGVDVQRHEEREHQKRWLMHQYEESDGGENRQPCGKTLAKDIMSGYMWRTYSTQGTRLYLYFRYQLLVFIKYTHRFMTTCFRLMRVMN